MKRLALLVVLLVAVLPSFADSITFTTFGFSGNGSQLLGPGLDPFILGFDAGGGIYALSFESWSGPLGAAVLLSTLTLPGFGSTRGPFMFQCDAAVCVVIFGFIVPKSDTVTPGVLSVTLNGVTETYNFRYMTPLFPAPEPTTLILSAQAWPRLGGVSTGRSSA
jgi:hypothetical protein